MLRTPHLQIALGLFLALGLLLPAFPAGSGWAAGTDKVVPGLQRRMAADPARRLPIIIEMAQPKGAPRSQSSLERANAALNLLSFLGPDGQGVGGLALIGGAAGYANARAINALSRNPNVLFLHDDAPIRSRVAAGDSHPAVPLAAPYPFAARADRAWLEGTTGRGVAVALLDSGIASHADLTLPTNRLLAAANFAGDLEGMPDAGGHGTHVAGIVAGNSTRSDVSRHPVQPLPSGDASPGDYVGIAPGANLVDVRVLNSQGIGRVSSAVRGIEWAVKHKNRLGIRVLNLSFGAPTTASYRQDPLSTAVEIAWKRGIVVVAAAGNRGPSGNTVETPGIDPFAITVGATDDQGTVSLQDDALAPFSSWGIPLDSTAKPEVVAPGRRIVSLRVPGSYLDRSYLDRVVDGRTGPNYFRLTGTSMSTGLVSGIAALMLERQPGLSPDQVKAILAGTVQPYGPGATVPPDPMADGYGLVDGYAAMSSPPVGAANRGLRPSDGFARVAYPLIYGQPLVWKDPSYAGINWSNLAWDNLAWDNLAWDDLGKDGQLLN